ncbi:bifunctional phosphoribosylaminoimidazole carboxylase/phosphoribosylaminoimidazole succinocarboxamide synthetase [Amia ocellicauda]|uniref:bifunctional phosphoribosylaminoimidazole carboxylase/phosphoribosylaminoimidazole succinocarboxamide synthetase n=1 Tax=Amia ocellicauda TaxID=2972642 RepID=UPI003464517E
MECGAGKHWSEEEVKALLTVWSEKNIQKFLHGATRNKAMFIYISNRLQDFGVFRDWKQCRAKYKNLKYEYRTVKYAQNSGDPGKSMKFFQELDAILASETVSGLPEEEEEDEEESVVCSNSDRINEEESQSRADIVNAGEICVALEEDDVSSTSDDPLPCSPSKANTCETGNPQTIKDQARLAFIPSVATEGGKHWTDDEVRALLYIWSDKKIQARLEGAARNKSIFLEIAKKLQRFGIDRDWKQCRTKYKNLKYEYKIAKNSLSCGNLWKSMKFFKELESILETKGSEPTDRKDGQEIDISEEKNNPGLGNSTVEDAVITCIKKEPTEADEDSVSITSEDLTIPSSWKRLLKDTEDRTPFDRTQIRVITVNDTGIGRNWSDEEVRALIFVWSDEKIRRQLEGATRNKDIFVKISRRLMQIGIDRDWKQCRTKYKNLKYVYRTLQRGKGKRSDPRRVMRFYDEVDAILKNSSGPQRKRSEEHSQPTDQNNSEEKGTPSRPDSRADSSADDEDSLCTVEKSVCRGTKRKARDEEPSISAKRGSKNRGSSKVEVPVQVHVEYKCKEEEDDSYTPIIQINSVCSITTSAFSPEKQDVPETMQHLQNARVSHPKRLQEVRYQPQCEHLSHLQLRRPLARSHTAEHAALLPYPQLLKLHLKLSVLGNRAWIRSQSPGHAAADAHSCASPVQTLTGEMASAPELKLGKKLNEGKTKEIYELPGQPGHVLVQSKDQITAGNAARKDQMEGKAAIANQTTCSVFKLLHDSGIKTAFVKQQSDTAFVAAHCEMIPIEWVCRRIATGSFLKRNPGVKEGYRFSPLKMEMFFKDDANNDPQWSEEQLIEAKFCFVGLKIGRCEIDVMNRSTMAIFEILEKAWATQDCTLVDMKIEFGVNVTTKEIVLADVIDNDSWRLWPSGDRSQQKDKQVYRDLKEITPEAMQVVKRNFEWVSERVKLLLEPRSSSRVVVLMGSTSDMAHCDKIKKACAGFGIACVQRVTSAHKGPDETLRIKAEYEGDGVPTVFVAVAGRSNGLGPVMSGNTAYPVINCPPVSPDWGAQDIWSSLRMPSGLGCTTILSPDAAAQFAAQIFGLTDHLVWAKLRASILNTWVSLKQADKKLQECSL